MTMEIRVDPQRLRRTLDAIVGERSPFSSQRHLTAVEGFIEKELEPMVSSSKAIIFRTAERLFATSLVV